MKRSFHPYAMITILFWSLAYVLTRLTLQYFSSTALGTLRYITASLALAAVAVLAKMRLPRKADIPWFLAAGAVGFFLYMLTFNKGVETVSASTSSVVIATVPVITALLARAVYREKLSLVQWIAIGVEFAGVAILTLLNGALSVNAGLLWLFLAALFLSAYNLIQRKLTKTYSALQTSAFSIFFGTLLLLIFLPTAVREVSAAPGVQLVYVAILGVFSSAVAYVAWSRAFALVKKTSQVSNYMFITPFLTSLLGVVLLQEVPDRATLIGGAVILFGALFFNFGEKILSYLGKNERA